MVNDSKVFYSLTKKDCKIKNILNNQFNYISFAFLRLLKDLCLNKHQFFIYRYFNDKSFFKFLIKVYLIKIVCIINKHKFLYLTHNIYHHKNNSFVNCQTINKILFRVSDYIYYFHPDQLRFISCQNKVLGQLRFIIDDYFISDSVDNKILSKLETWLFNKDNILLFVSTSTLPTNFIENLFDVQNAIIIVPGNTSGTLINDNIFLYNKPLYNISSLLRSKKVVGLTYHNNISISTSYFSFIYNKWPVLSLSGSCTSTLVQQHNTGEIYYKISEISIKFKEIISRYDDFKSFEMLKYNEFSSRINRDLLSKCI